MLKITKQDFNLLLAAGLIALFAFAGIYAKHAIGAETLSIVVGTYSVFNIDTDNFPAVNLTPGTPVWATSTLSVTTNLTTGWNVTLYANDRDTGDTTMDLSTDAAVGIIDDTEWNPGAATTSESGVPATTLTLGDDVLAFRVMSASGTSKFWSTTWWGTSDVDFDGNQKWAGFASSTSAGEIIGEVHTGDYSSSAVINTVKYYLDVPGTQKTGTYNGNLVYTLVTA